MYSRAKIFYDFNEEEIPISKNPAKLPKYVPLMNDSRTQIPVGIGPNPFMESCATKVIMSGVMGYVMGNAMGLVFGSYESITPPIPIPGQRIMPKTPIPEQLKASWRLTSDKCKYWGNNFMIVTAIFSGVECLLEKQRGKHDIVNGTVAGCVTGATLAAGQGPQAMCLGCAGFAAFSMAVEHFMGD